MGRSDERVEAWRPALDGVSEVFHAHFVEHEYPPHSHDVWTVIVVDQGAIRYELEHRPRAGDTSTISILPPHTVHDGRAATQAGFTKRVLYLDSTVLPIELTGRAVDASEVSDDLLRLEVSALHDALRLGEDRLDGEERLDRISRRLRRHLAGQAGEPLSSSADHRDADRLRQFLESHANNPVTLDQASKAIGRSIGHLSRSFRTSYGISPHAYVIGLRVERARRLLLDGCSPSAAATAAGFYDQAHLHRHFIKHTGTTPGGFAGGARADQPK